MQQAALAFWLARDARAVSRALELEPEALGRLAAHRLRDLLVDAMRSPFHASRMRAAGLSRADADRNAAGVLHALAPVTKHDLRAAGDGALRDARISPGWFSSRSSGSSGEPFRVFYDARAWSMLKYLVKMRSRRAAGVRLADRIAILDAIPIADEGRAPLERAGRLARLSIFRPPSDIAARLAAYRPDAIYALPSALLEICRALDAGAPRFGARRIFTSGELLTATARRTIASTLRGALFDVYGTSETKEIAWECVEGSRHINSDVVLVEILDARGDAVPAGIEGEIVVTLLVNRAMPLIRYRTGDRGALLDHRCSCGGASPLLGVVSGREADSLELPDGTTLSPYLLTMALEWIPGLAQYQIVQVEPDLLRVSVVGLGAMQSTGATALERAVEGALREALPREVRIEVATVERLPRGAREKVRVVHPLSRFAGSLTPVSAAPGVI